MARILDVDDAQVTRAGEKVARGLCVGGLGYAVGDLDERVAEMAGFDVLGGETVGEVFARAAQVEHHIHADGVEHVGDDADDDELIALLAAAGRLGAREGGKDLIQHLHQHAGDRHDEEVAIDDVAQLVGDDRARLVLVEEFEDAVGQHDAGVGAQQAVGEGGRIAVRDDADGRRLEAVFLGDVVDDGVHVRMLGRKSRIIEKRELVDPPQHQVRQPWADEKQDEIDDGGDGECRAELQ